MQVEDQGASVDDIRSQAGIPSCTWKNSIFYSHDPTLGFLEFTLRSKKGSSSCGESRYFPWDEQSLFVAPWTDHFEINHCERKYGKHLYMLFFVFVFGVFE